MNFKDEHLAVSHKRFERDKGICSGASMIIIMLFRGPRLVRFVVTIIILEAGKHSP
jgi:hypothetical protein